MGKPIILILTQVAQQIWAWLRRGFQTSLYMFKFMVPVTILVKILQETNWITYIGDALAPLMRLCGLPGEMGLVWASTLISNIYGGLVAYFQLAGSIPLSTAQVTILSTIMLVAHTFPIELMVANRCGVRLWFGFSLRFIFAFLAGVLLHQIYSLLGVLESAPMATAILEAKPDQSLGQWTLNEAKNYGLIAVWITALIIILDILKKLGIIELINRLLEPVLRHLGIGKEVIPITVVGMTLGLAYGGGLIINQVKTEGLNKRNVLYAIVLMSLCHSMIEDSLLMMSIGAHYTGVFIFRIGFALLITFGFVRLTRGWNESRMQRWFYHK